jgi:hypothetical protein
MVSGQIQQSVQRQWLRPIGRAVLMILIGIYGQMILAIPIWYALGAPEQLSVAAELGIKVITLLVECSVLLLIALDKESLSRYINVQSPRRILLFGLLGAVPLIAANRLMQGWIIRAFHGEFAYYFRLTGSNLGAVLFLLLQLAYYFFEVFVLIYAYAKLAEGLRAWRTIPRWAVILTGGFFLFVTWSLAHGFVLTDPLALSIGIYLPLIFVVSFEFTGSLVAPLITWLLFLMV